MSANRAAAAVRAILVDFDANFEAGLLDEAYLDVTDYCQQHGLTGTPLHYCFSLPGIHRRVILSTCRWL